MNSKSRARGLQRLGAGQGPLYDAVIIGGGIVGAGVARELALRGLKIVLFEKGDFASATSSKSSKLIHGGLRYLEMYDFGLVFEALAERHWLIKTHPHLVLPLEFVLPLYEREDSPSPAARPGWMLQMGLWLYDGLALFRTPFFHKKLTAARMKEKFPGLRMKGLEGGLAYADAMMMDDEMVLECLADAHLHGAESYNYARVEKVALVPEPRSPREFLITVKENLPPQATAHRATSGEAFTVRTKEVITCVGPWTDRMGDVFQGGSGMVMKPSRGIHLLIPWKRFPIDGCLVMFAPDKRIIFVIPRKDFGAGAEMVIVGTTDAPERGDLDEVHAHGAEVQYLLANLASFFPDAKLTEKDIVSTYAGVRPLLDEGASNEAKTSREHEIWHNSDGVVFVAGGKYTTFRPMSAEIADFAFPGTKAGDSKQPLSKAEEYKARGQGGKPLWGRFTEEDVRWALSNQVPLTLEDVVFRRTPLWTQGPGLERRILERVADLCAAALGWDSARRGAEIKATEAKLAMGMQWRARGD